MPPEEGDKEKGISDRKNQDPSAQTSEIEDFEVEDASSRKAQLPLEDTCLPCENMPWNQLGSFEDSWGDDQVKGRRSYITHYEEIEPVLSLPKEDKQSCS